MRIAICDDDPKASNSLYQDITKIAEEQLNNTTKQQNLHLIPS